MKIATRLRGRRGAKIPDLSVLRELLRDTRVWCSLGVVVVPDEEPNAEHWEFGLDASGQPADILVEVLLVPSNMTVTARLGGFAGASGVIKVPDVGDEVLILFPDGQQDWMPTLVARLSTGTVPNPGGGQGPGTGRTVIMDQHVFVHDGTGGAEPLVKRSEFNGHTHGPGSFTAPSGGGSVTGASGGADDVTGTEVLRSK